MAMTFMERLSTLDRSALTLPVRRAVGSQAVEIVNWQCQQIHGGAGDYDTDALGVGGIARFTGQGLDQGRQLSWSLIFKALPLLRASPDPYRGTRELYAYQSGLLDHLPGDIAVPRYLGSVEEPGEASCLWLEDITDEVGKPWPLPRFGLVARHFGQLNGVYLSGHALPAASWLSRRWLRGCVARRADAIAELATVLDHPWVRRRFPEESAERTLRLWAERETFLHALEQLPQTFCHLDVFPRNLFARSGPHGRAQTVAVDWAFTGLATLGEEIVPLIWGSIGFFEVALAQLPALEELVFESYLDGLRDAGWHGSRQAVRLGYALAAPLRYGFPRLRTLLTEQHSHPGSEHIFGRPVGEVVDVWAHLQLGLLRLAEEARETLQGRR